MKNFFLTLSLLLCCCISACCPDHEIVPPLRIEDAPAILHTNESLEIKIVSGSGDYELVESQPQIATTSLIGDRIVIKALKEGRLRIVLRDKQSHQTQILELTLKNRALKFKLSSSQILEQIKIREGKSFPLEGRETKESWLARLANTSPTAIELSVDSLHLIYPYDIVERLPMKREKTAIYCQSPEDGEWLLCGKTSSEGLTTLTFYVFAIERKLPHRTSFYQGKSCSVSLPHALKGEETMNAQWAKIECTFQ